MSRKGEFDSGKKRLHKFRHVQGIRLVHIGQINPVVNLLLLQQQTIYI